MGRDLYEAFSTARTALDEANDVLGFPLTELMFSGPQEVLKETHNAQPALLAHSIAVWRTISLGGEPTDAIAAGHSLGEYSAYVAAGSLRYRDALRIVRRRGELMLAAGRERPGAMAAVLGAERDAVLAACAAAPGVARAANFNSPTQIVISGEAHALAAAAEDLKRRGAKRIVALEVSGAFHSPLMESAAAGLREALESIEIADARFPVYANASATPVTRAEEIRASLVKQLLNPVLWESTVREIAGRGPAEFFEIGSGKVLQGLLRAIDRGWVCRTLGTADEVAAFLGEC
jgi:[acyl-carrier-protein] S-malonyltransferase